MGETEADEDEFDTIWHCGNATPEAETETDAAVAEAVDSVLLLEPSLNIDMWQMLLTRAAPRPFDLESTPEFRKDGYRNKLN